MQFHMILASGLPARRANVSQPGSLFRHVCLARALTTFTICMKLYTLIEHIQQRRPMQFHMILASSLPALKANVSQPDYLFRHVCLARALTTYTICMKLNTLIEPIQQRRPMQIHMILARSLPARKANVSQPRSLYRHVCLARALTTNTICMKLNALIEHTQQRRPMQFHMIQASSLPARKANVSQPGSLY